MALIYTIRQEGLFKKNADFALLQKLLGSAMNVGGVGNFGIFDSTPAPPQPGQETGYLVYGKKGPIGRGFQIYVGADGASLELSCPLPATTHDLEDFFTVAGILMEHLGAKYLIGEDGEKIPRPSLTTVFAQQKADNGKIIKKVIGEGGEGQVISGVKMPIHIPESLRRHVQAVPPANAEVYFSSYLNEKQKTGYFYMAPEFLQKEDGSVSAAYTLTQGVHSIIPKAAGIPYQPSPVQEADVTEWLLEMRSADGDPLGNLPYAAFLEKLEESELAEFDDAHYLLRGVGALRMRELLGG